MDLEEQLTRRKIAEEARETIVEETRLQEAEDEKNLKKKKAVLESEELEAKSKVVVAQHNSEAEYIRAESETKHYQMTADVETEIKRRNSEIEIQEYKRKKEADAKEYEARMKADADKYKAEKETDALYLQTSVAAVGGPQYHAFIRRMEEISSFKLPQNVYGAQGWIDTFAMRLMGELDDKSPSEQDDDSSKMWDPIISFLKENPTQLVFALKTIQEYSRESGEAILDSKITGFLEDNVGEDLTEDM